METQWQLTMVVRIIAGFLMQKLQVTFVLRELRS